MSNEMPADLGRKPLITVGLNWPMAGLLVSAVLPMYFRGLFFMRDQIIAFVLVGSFFLIWMRSTALDIRTLATTRLDLTALGLAAVYVATVPFAAQPHAALTELFKYGLYLMVFFLASRLPNKISDRLTVLWALLIGIAGTAIVGLLAVSGPWRYPGALMDYRLASTFQYPNSFASVLAAGFVLALGLMEIHSKRGTRLLVSGLASLLLLSFIYTYSRGALVILPIAVAALIALLPKERRPMAIARTLAIILAVTAGMPWFGKGLQKSDGLVWQGWMLTLALTLVLTFLLELPDIKRYLPVMAIALVVVLAVGGIVLVSHLPKTLLDRLGSFSFSQRSFWERLAWDYDALKIILASPLVGYGGGGWQAVYTRFQSYGYVTTVPHNAFMQTGVETGLVGLALLVAVWFFFVKALSLKGRTDPEDHDGLFIRTVVVTGLTIGVHSIVDFDLSLSGISIVLWTLFGLANGVVLQGRTAHRQVWWARAKSKPNAFYHRQTFWLTAIFLIMALIGASFISGNVIRQRALDEYCSGKIDKAVADMLLASKLDPLNPAVWTLAAQLEEQKENYDVAYRLNKRALTLDRYDATILTVQSRLAYRIGNADEAITTAKRAISAQPQVPLRYETLADLYFSLGKYFLGQSGEQARAQAEFFFKLIPPLAQQMRDRSESNRFKNAPDALPPATAPMELYVGQSYLVLNQDEQAVEHFRAAVQLADKTEDKDLKAESYMWLGLGLQRVHNQGDPEAQAFLRKAFSLDLSVETKYVDALKWLKQGS